MKRKTILLTLLAFVLLGNIVSALGPMAVNWWVMGGGEAPRNVAPLRINATIGQPAIGRSSSGPLALSWGYWPQQISTALSPRGYLPLLVKWHSS
jgi:hypothetical protein